MKTSIRDRVIIGSILWLGGLTAGCATVITPLPGVHPISTDGDHGLLIGHAQLTWHEPRESPAVNLPSKMKWSLEE